VISALRNLYKYVDLFELRRVNHSTSKHDSLMVRGPAPEKHAAAHSSGCSSPSILFACFYHLCLSLISASTTQTLVSKSRKNPRCRSLPHIISPRRASVVTRVTYHTRPSPDFYSMNRRQRQQLSIHNLLLISCKRLERPKQAVPLL
jgi:hypothetical protein